MHQNHVLVACVRYRSNIIYQNLPPEDYWPGVQHVYTASQPTSMGFFAGAVCLYISEPTLRVLFARVVACFPIYPKVTPGDCRPRMQPVYILKE